MRFSLGLLFLARVLCLAPNTPAAAGDADGFAPLFNGKDLAGWKPILRQTKEGKDVDPKDVWSVTDGAIRCLGKPNGYIATDKEYSNYILRVKWRFPADAKAGNSGVLLHVQKEDKVWPMCVEAQLRAGRAGDIWLTNPPDVTLEVDPTHRDKDDKTMRHIFRQPKDEAVEKAFGEWNEYLITCKGGDITLVVNGRKVNEGKNGSLTRGRIALQSEGTEIHFKDIAIKAAN